LPDGESGIFLQKGLDRLLGDLPVGQFCRTHRTQIAVARDAKQPAVQDPDGEERSLWTTRIRKLR
jgi:hypothetical protein